jgi:hypothetical protein
VEHQSFEKIVFSDINKGDFLLFNSRHHDLEFFALVLSQPVIETIAGDEYFIFDFLDTKINKKRQYFFLLTGSKGDIKRLVINE